MVLRESNPIVIIALGLRKPSEVLVMPPPVEVYVVGEVARPGVGRVAQGEAGCGGSIGSELLGALCPCLSKQQWDSYNQQQPA